MRLYPLNDPSARHIYLPGHLTLCGRRLSTGGGAFLRYNLPEEVSKKLREHALVIATYQGCEVCYKRFCFSCSAPRDQHDEATGKCLFQPTFFENPL